MTIRLSTSGQKEIQKLPTKYTFKIVTFNKVIIPNNVIIPEEVPSSTQVFNSCFVDEIKDPYTDKAYKKSYLVVYTYNNKKKNLVLMHLSKILDINQGIGSYLASIIQYNDNDNIEFYLWDII